MGSHTSAGVDGGRKPKPDELLASVVRETAVPGAVGLLAQNLPFVFPDGHAWAVLLLEASAIGGLSRRHRRDEAKGSLIELIESDQIETVATAGMLAEDVFGIIPTAGTLERMSEYALLTGAAYRWAILTVSEGDLMVDVAGEATFQAAGDVAAGTLGLREAVGADAWATHAPAGEAPAAPHDVTDGVPAGAHARDGGGTQDDGDDLFDREPVHQQRGQDVPQFQDAWPAPAGAQGDNGEGVDGQSVSQGTGVPAGDTRQIPVPEPVDDYPDSDLDGDEVDPGGEVPGRGGDDVDDGVVVDEERVAATIVRRFLPEDLDLQVDLDTFTTAFPSPTDSVRIATPEGATDWLGGQVAHMVQQANTRLAQRRAAHQEDLRHTYVHLMSMLAQQVIAAVATSGEPGSTPYADLMATAEREHHDHLAGKEARVRDAQEWIRTEFEQEADARAQAAAATARAAFLDRNRARIDREQAAAAASVQQAIEDDRAAALAEILRVRRSDAALKLEVGRTEILQLLSERRAEQLRAEAELIDQAKDEIGRVVEDNRQHDIARATAIADELARSDEIAVLRREQTEHAARVQAEHASQVARLTEQLDQARSQAAAELRRRETAWNSDLNRAERRSSELLDQMDHVATVMRTQFDERVAELEADRASYVRELDRSARIQRRTNRLQLPLMVLLLVIVGGLGILVGALAIQWS